MKFLEIVRHLFARRSLIVMCAVIAMLTCSLPVEAGLRARANRHARLSIKHAAVATKAACKCGCRGKCNGQCGCEDCTCQ